MLKAQIVAKKRPLAVCAKGRKGGWMRRLGIGRLEELDGSKKEKV
jgi:hypothetical protein